MDMELFGFWFFLGLAAWLLSIAAKELFRYNRLRKEGIETQVQVKSVSPHWARQSGYTVHLCYAVGDRTQMLRYKMLYTRPGFEVGERVTAFRDPADAQKLLLEGDKNPLIGSGIAAVVGVFFLLLPSMI